MTGTASARVAVPARSCFALLEAVEHYPSWIGEFVRDVDVLERNTRGAPARALATVHVEQSPFGKDFELLVEIETDVPDTVRLTRIPAHPADEDRLELVWRLDEGDETHIAFEFLARISFLPSLLPVGDAGDTIAQAALGAAAEALQDGHARPRRRPNRRS